jgi:hypothetical protein
MTLICVGAAAACSVDLSIRDAEAVHLFEGKGFQDHEVEGALQKVRLFRAQVISPIDIRWETNPESYRMSIEVESSREGLSRRTCRHYLRHRGYRRRRHAFQRIQLGWNSLHELHDLVRRR